MSRTVVNRAPHREVGVVNPGWLLDHPVQHESHLERRFIMAALACPVVRDIIHQPFTLKFDLGAPEGDRQYTPDFKLVFRDGNSLIVEVKPKVFADRHAARLSRIAERLHNDGLAFLVATDQMIDGHALSARALLLMRYGRLRFSDEEALACLKTLRDMCNGSASVRELVEKGLSEPLIWHLVARHQCRVPADFTVDPEQVLTTDAFEGDCRDYFHAWLGAEGR